METSPTRKAPSGAQYRIAHGDHEATIVEVGAALREYRVAGRDVVQSYPEDEVSWNYHGCVLVPWPNRIAAGQYEFDGESYQLPITEPARNSALHGLAAWRRWRLVEHSADRVALSLALLPSPGYPFFLDTVVEYSLDADGLRVRATATNTGARACPVAIGFHAYAAPAPGTTIDECTLSFGVRRHLIPDDVLIPIGDEPVAGAAFDFAAPRRVGETSMDDAFAGAVRDADGLWWFRLTGADGKTVAFWADDSFDYWQLYTGDTLPPHWRRRGLAAEPMTAAPNAFRSGDGLIKLEPGRSVTAVWGATLL